MIHFNLKNSTHNWVVVGNIADVLPDIKCLVHSVAAKTHTATKPIFISLYEYVCIHVKHPISHSFCLGGEFHRSYATQSVCGSRTLLRELSWDSDSEYGNGTGGHSAVWSYTGIVPSPSTSQCGVFRQVWKHHSFSWLDQNNHPSNLWER